MEEIQEIWFKYNSPARKWLEKNLDLDKSFSQTFRTTGGSFSFYEYEIVLNGCIINSCRERAIGSFSTKGGSRLALCDIHLDKLMELQNPNQTHTSLIFLLKLGIPQLVSLILANPIISSLLQLDASAFFGI